MSEPAQIIKVPGLREAKEGKLVPMGDMEDLWDTYIRMRGPLAKTTLNDYNFLKKHFLSVAAKHEVGPALAKAWVHHVQTNHRMGPGKTMWANNRIRSFLRWLHDYNYVRQDYAKLIPLPKLASRFTPPEIITEEEYQTIKNFCKGRPNYQVLLWMTILGYRTGMSPVDCAHLRWCEVFLNFNGPSYIQKERRKTKRHGASATCIIPLVPGTDVFEWLMKLKSVAHLNYKRFDGINDYVHQDAPGLYEAHMGDFNDQWRVMKKATGITKLMRHLRCSFISNLVNSGVQVNQIMRMVGHKDPTMIMTYLKPDVQSLQAGLAKAYDYAAGATEDRNMGIATGKELMEKVGGEV